MIDLKQRITLPMKPSTKQWVASFLAIDAAFWAFVIIGCVVSFMMCGVSGTFAIAFFYPFWWIPFLSSLSTLSSFVVLTVIGVALHALLGFVASELVGERKVSWMTSTAVAAATLAAFTSGMVLLLSKTGFM